MKRCVGVSIVFLLCLATAAMLSGCGQDSGVSQQQLQRAREDAAHEARQQAKLQQLKRQVKTGSHGETSTVIAGGTTTTVPTNSGGIPADARDCGSAFAGGDASCPFVENVRRDYYASGQVGSFTSYSPVTQKSYTVSCSGSSPTVCTAGNAAIIYIP